MKTNRSKGCPYCGHIMPYNAAACPECGSDERTGWSENTYLDGIDTGDDFDYEETVSNEFSSEKIKKIPVWKLATGLLLLLIFMGFSFRSCML